jgi:hypothetical protein
MRASKSFQRLVSSESYGRRVIDGTWNGVEDDVKDDQKNDQSYTSTFSICAVHDNSSFVSLTSVSS